MDENHFQRIFNMFFPLYSVKYVFFSLAVCALISSPGCTPSGPAVRYVEGTVIYDNAPLSKAQVIFHPKSAGGIGATGFTDENGVFRLTSLQGGTPGKGAVAGEYDITISRPKDEPSSYMWDEAAEGRIQVPIYESLIPKKYNVASTSGLSANVDKKRNRFEFKLDKE